MSVQTGLQIRHEGALLDSDTVLARAIDFDVQRPWDLEGLLRIRDEEDGLDLSLDDTLVPFAQGVLESLLALVRTGHASVSRTGEYGYLRLDVEGVWIRLGGDGFPSARVDRDSLIHGLLRAVGRLADLLDALGLDGFDRQVLIEDRREVIEALAKPGWVLDGIDSLPPLGAPAPREEADGPVVLLQAPQLGWSCDGKSVLLPGEPAAWEPLLTRLVLPAVQSGRQAVAPFPDGYGYARFDSEGCQVRISGDGMADLRLPRKGFLRCQGVRATT